jgi:nitrogen fixation-related uncharacterized protein
MLGFLSMTIPPAILLLLGVAAFGAAGALAAFVWAAGTGQLDPGNQGARVIFDDDEPEGLQ